jgi:hypothetical protein
MKKLTQTWNWRGHARLRIGLLAAAMFLTRDVASGQLATLDERTRGAEVVVVATVGTITPKWVSNDYGDRLIVSRVELRIDETLKGTPQQTAWLDLMGGTLDGYTLHVSSLPAVQNGERGVFFLHPEASGVYTPYLKGQGILLLDEQGLIRGSDLRLDEIRTRVRSVGQDR